MMFRMLGWPWLGGTPSPLGAPWSATGTGWPGCGSSLYYVCFVFDKYNVHLRCVSYVIDSCFIYLHICVSHVSKGVWCENLGGRHCWGRDVQFLPHVLGQWAGEAKQREVCFFMLFAASSFFFFLKPIFFHVVQVCQRWPARLLLGQNLANWRSCFS